MKKIKMSKLIIENKRILIKEDSDYEDLGDIIPVGDIAKFGKESLKFLGNLSIFWAKSGWAAFRYKILNNISKKDFESSLKNGRITFLSNSDRNISNIDSMTATLLSKAGISKSEIDSYLLGFPGFNVLEKIDLTNVLSGRVFNASRYNQINMTSVGPEDLLLFFAISELSNGLGEDLKTKTDAEIFELVSKINSKNKDNLINQIKSQLSSEKNLMRKLKALTKSTDEKLLSVIRQIMRPTSNQPGSIVDESKSRKFCDIVNKELPKMKMSITDSYKLTIKDQKLIKEESKRDDANLVVLSFLHSISKSALYLNNNLIKEFLENILSNNNLKNTNIQDFGKLKEMLETIAVALWSSQAAATGAKIVKDPDIIKSADNADMVNVAATFDRYKESIEESFKGIEKIISSSEQKVTLKDYKNKLDELIDENFLEPGVSEMNVSDFNLKIANPIIEDANNTMFNKNEMSQFKDFAEIAKSQFNKDFLNEIDKDLSPLIDYCSSEKIKSINDM